MVEEGGRDIRIHLRSSVNQHRIALNACHGEHGCEQGCLITADTITVLKGHADFMRLISRGSIFSRNPHVADFLRDKLEDAADLLVACGGSFNQLIDHRLHFRISLLERRLAEIPIPAGDLAPVLDRAEHDPLCDGLQRWHVGLRKDLRHIAELPEVTCAIVGQLCLRVGDRV